MLLHVEPESFGPYLLKRLRGRGGMGEVFQAIDTRKNRMVALKRLPTELADDIDFQRRFRREAELAARLSDPHVIPIHDYGEIDGHLFLDMRYVEGEDLAEILRAEGQLEVSRTLSIIEQVADALDDAHRSGLLHRDVKPSNIIVTPTGFAYLVDFGIAKSIDLADTALTQTGSVIGTLDYMAPERFAGSSDGRADVYALACVLYECLAGRKPFRGATAPEILYSHLRSIPSPISAIRADVPATVDQVIRTALDKSPERRHATAGAFAQSARAAHTGAPSPLAPQVVDASPTSTTIGSAPRPDEPPTAPFPRHSARPRIQRRRPIIATAAAAAVVAALILGFTLWPRTSAGEDSAAPSVPALTATIDEPIYMAGPSSQIVVSADGTRAFVADYGNVATREEPNVNVVDLAEGYIENRFSIGMEIDSIAVSADPNFVYIEGSTEESFSSRLYVVETTNWTVVRDYDIGPASYAFAVSPDGRLSYHSTDTTDALRAYDTTTGEQVAEIPALGLPSSMVISPDGTRAYLVGGDNSGSDFSVLVIDLLTQEVVAQAPADVGGLSTPAALSADGSRLYLHEFSGLLILDTTNLSVVRQIPVADITGFALLSNGNQAYVVKGSRQLTLVDFAEGTTTDLQGVETDDAAFDIALAPDDTKAYVASNIFPRLTVVNFAK